MERQEDGWRGKKGQNENLQVPLACLQENERGRYWERRQEESELEAGMGRGLELRLPKMSERLGRGRQGQRKRNALGGCIVSLGHVTAVGILAAQKWGWRIRLW